jgi:hypothetical protein
MWLQTTFVLAWLWLKSAILWPATVAFPKSAM